MKRRIVLVPASALLVAAAPLWKTQALRSAAPYIDRANEEWTRAVVTGNADVMSAPYDQRGVFIGPDGSAIQGKTAVRAMYAKPRGGAKILKASIRSDGRAAADPDDVYEWGTATMTVQREGKTRQASGRYLTVWHREGASWLITRNVAF